MSNFTVTRSTEIAAPPATVHALVNDFHHWVSWSPWEGLDPTLARSYTGPESGTGAQYSWQGNRKAGAGSMEITASEPAEIAITLAFLKPWKATNQVAFTFEPTETGTAVTWTMNGAHAGLGKVFAIFMSMDKLVGNDFEKGLAALKQESESASAG